MNYAVITGASSGLGIEFARLFAKDGYHLVLVARNKEKLENLRNELISTYSINVLGFSTDLAKEESVKQLFEFVKQENIIVDCLVNNAGFGDSGAFVESNLNRQIEMVNVNVLALIKLTRLFGEEMSKNKNGKILNVASVAAFFSGPYMANYYATKNYVLAFSMAVNEELKRSGVSVTALCPGPTKTGFEKNANLTKSKMFKIMKPASAEKVALVGYKAMIKRKRTAYYGFVGKFLNILSHIFPRRWALIFTKDINKPTEKQD